MKNREKQREAAKRHYEANKETMKDRAKAVNIRRRTELRRMVLTHLLGNSCVDCGEADPVVLEFDHRDPRTKSFNIGDGVARDYGTGRIVAEIAKCDVRCANCHRRRTRATVWADMVKDQNPQGQMTLF